MRRGSWAVAGAGRSLQCTRHCSGLESCRCRGQAAYRPHSLCEYSSDCALLQLSTKFKSVFEISRALLLVARECCDKTAVRNETALSLGQAFEHMTNT